MILVFNIVLVLVCLVLVAAAFMFGAVLSAARDTEDEHTIVVVAKCAACPLAVVDGCEGRADVRLN